MKLIIPTFALFLLAGGCSTVTLTLAAGDGTATAEGTPIVRKRNAGDSNPFSNARGGGSGDDAGRNEERAEVDDDDDDDDDEDEDERRIIEARGPLRLDIPAGESRRLILRRTDGGTILELAPEQHRPPRIL